jgi:hypothetical protein
MQYFTALANALKINNLAKTMRTQRASSAELFQRHLRKSTDTGSARPQTGQNGRTRRFLQSVVT